MVNNKETNCSFTQSQCLYVDRKSRYLFVVHAIISSCMVDEVSDTMDTRNRWYAMTVTELKVVDEDQVIITLIWTDNNK